MIARAEGVTLQNPIELLKLAPMEGDDRFGLEDALVPMQPGACRQGPEKSAEPLHGTRLLENLDMRHHRLEDDRQGGHTVSRQNSSRVSSYSSVSCICLAFTSLRELSVLFFKKDDSRGQQLSNRLISRDIFA